MRKKFLFILLFFIVFITGCSNNNKKFVNFLQKEGYQCSKENGVAKEFNHCSSGEKLDFAFYPERYEIYVNSRIDLTNFQVFETKRLTRTLPHGKTEYLVIYDIKNDTMQVLVDFLNGGNFMSYHLDLEINYQNGDPEITITKDERDLIDDQVNLEYFESTAVEMAKEVREKWLQYLEDANIKI